MKKYFSSLDVALASIQLAAPELPFEAQLRLAMRWSPVHRKQRNRIRQEMLRERAAQAAHWIKLANYRKMPDEILAILDAALHGGHPEQLLISATSHLPSVIRKNALESLDRT
jgi:hypothetical protein